MTYQDRRNRETVDVYEFCVKLDTLALSAAEKAVAILWFLSECEGRQSATPGDLARIIKRSGLGNPNSTTLALSIRKTGYVLWERGSLILKPTSREKVREQLAAILEPEAPKVPTDSEFIPKAVWSGTRGYIERIAEQINGCYHCTFYDGASVLCRKLIEILIIEAFEQHKIESRIRDSKGEYYMLRDLINSLLGPNGLPVGRETKQVLNEVKTIGDRSAHNRRYVAVKQDLDGLRLGYRLAVDELLHLSVRK